MDREKALITAANLAKVQAQETSKSSPRALASVTTENKEVSQAASNEAVMERPPSDLLISPQVQDPKLTQVLGSSSIDIKVES
ncbi:hypothetical protein V5O48_010123, partial [Marasmius crinis-equi]